MAIKKYNPTSNGRRNMTGYDFSEITKSTPEKTLLESSKNNAGRNSQGKSLYVTKVADTNVLTV